MTKTNLLLAALALVLCYVTCQNLKKTADPAAAAPAENPAAPPAATEPESVGNWRASHVFHDEQPDNALARQVKAPPRRVEVPWDKLPKPSTSRRAFMSTGWWHPIMAFQPSDTTVHLNYIPKWLRFRDDLTFDILIKGQVAETGNWNFDEEKMILYLSCKDPYFNNTWAIQERGFRMVLVGNTDLNVTGIQLRLDGSPTPPPTD